MRKTSPGRGKMSCKRQKGERWHRAAMTEGVLPLLRLRLGCELCVVHHKALVGAAAYRAFFVVQGHLEGELAAFYRHQLALAGNGHAHRGGGSVLQLKLCAHRAAALVQRIGHAHPAGLFRQSHKGRGGKHVQRAAAHGLCCIGCGDEHALFPADTGFQCHILSSPFARRMAHFIFEHLYKIPHFAPERTLFCAFL